MPKPEAPGDKTVLVDMDGVLADFEEPNNDIVRMHFPAIPVVMGRTDFYFKDTYKNFPEVVEKVESECRQPGFIRNFPVVDGAVQGWERILACGYFPRVCSSPLENHDTIIDEKKAWLEEHFVPVFGSWVVDSAKFNRDKSGYDAFAMIDDRPSLRNIEKAAWQHIIFSRSYNKTVKTDSRIKDWFDSNLECLLDRARRRYLDSQA